MLNWEYINESYLYDGSFYGLLTIVFDAYVNNKIPNKIYSEEKYIENLLDNIVYIQTNEKKALRIIKGILKNISNETLYIAYNAFLCGKEGKEINIVKYIIAAFKTGPKINSMLWVDYVFETIALKRVALFESHRLKGLIKFRCIDDNLYYAPIHPDNNVVEYLGKHFVNRLPTQNFIIHDKNRNIAFVYNLKETYITIVPANFKLSEFSKEEKEYQELWKTFFKTIAIKERTNSRLQKNYMPKRYWKDLVEEP